jgi:hypothetical protein
VGDALVGERDAVGDRQISGSSQVTGGQLYFARLAASHAHAATINLANIKAIARRFDPVNSLVADTSQCNLK